MRLARAGVDGIRIAGRKADHFDRQGGSVVRDRGEAPPGVGRAPDAALGGAEQDDIGVGRVDGNRQRAPAGILLALPGIGDLV